MQADNELARSMLAKYQHDETEMARALLDNITAQSEQPLSSLRVLNLLLNNKLAGLRQRRDVAGLCRVVADSSVFLALQSAVRHESQQSESGEWAFESSKLICSICTENPHYIDNILTSSELLLDRLLTLLANPQRMPTAPDSLICSVNFYHAISMKEGRVRQEKLRPSLERFVYNILTNDRFSEFSLKKYMFFLNTLFKFQSNVPEVSRYLFHSLMRAARWLNELYKDIGEGFELRGTDQLKEEEEVKAIIEKTKSADRKLSAVLRLYDRAKNNVFSRFDPFSFNALLKILLKIALTRPVALVGLPSENKMLCGAIGDLMVLIMNYQEVVKREVFNDVTPRIRHEDIKGTKIPVLTLGTEDRPKKQEAEEMEEEEKEQNEQPHEVSSEMAEQTYNEQEIARLRMESNKFRSTREMALTSPETYNKIIKSSITTLLASLRLESQYLFTTFNEFLISVLTVRLQRMMVLMMRLFSKDELLRNNFYQNLVVEISPLLPYFYDRSVRGQLTLLTNELPQLTDIVLESKMSITRFLFEELEEQSVKNNIHAKLIESLDVNFIFFETAIRFGYHLTHIPEVLIENTKKFIHPFIRYFRREFLGPLNQRKDEPITLLDIERLRIMLKFTTELFPLPMDQSRQPEELNCKLYTYCSCASLDKENSIFALIGDILNAVERHSPESTSNIIDTPENRKKMTCTIFAKLICQRIRTFINSVTACNLAVIPMEVADQKEFIERMEQHYINYNRFASCVVALIQKIAVGGPREHPQREDILAMLLSNLFAYTFSFQEPIPLTNLPAEHVDFQKQYKDQIDALSQILAIWVFDNLDKPLLKVPAITEKILHFCKLKTRIENADLQINQQQNSHVVSVFNLLSQTINELHFDIYGIYLNLGVSSRRKNRKRKEAEEKTINQIVMTLSNLCLMIGQLLKQLIEQGLPLLLGKSLGDNYITSILDFGTQLMSDFQAQKHCPTEMNSFIRSSLWLVEVYLKYKDLMVQTQTMMKKEKRREKRKEKKQRETRLKKQAKRDKAKRKKMEEIRLELDNKEKEPVEQENPKANASRENSSQKLKRRPKEIKLEDDSRFISRSESKHNLMEGLVKLEEDPGPGSSRRRQQRKQERREQKKKAKQNKNLQNKINTYLKNTIVVANRATCPLLTDLTLQYIFHFLNNNTASNPQSKSFEIDIVSFIQDLLTIKITSNKMPGYHFLLCKLGIQLLDDPHIKIDHQLGVKRFFFENMDKEIPLKDFLDFIGSNYEKVVPEISNMIDVLEVTEVEGEKKSQKKPLTLDIIKRVEGLKRFVVLKQHIELHLLNIKTDVNLKRKPSGAEDREKSFKSTDYVPQGDIGSFIRALIIQSIRVAIIQIDQSFTEVANKDSYKSQFSTEPFNIKSILHTLQFLVRESPSLAPWLAKYKCRKVVLQMLKSEKLKNREETSNMVLGLLNGFKENNELGGLSEVGYLTLVLKLFSPLFTTTISGLVFELCLDSTPLVQVTEGTKDKKPTYAPFGSVIRMKTMEEIAYSLFGKKQSRQHLFRSLCLINLTTVLMNIREMSKLFIESRFVQRLAEQFQSTAAALSQAWKQTNGDADLLLPSQFHTKISIPFFLNPMSLLQQLNIFFHHSKKMNKNAQKLSISTILTRQSINAQLVPKDSLRKNIFKKDWPHRKHAQDPHAPLQPPPTFYDERDSESEQEQDSENREDSSGFDSDDSIEGYDRSMQAFQQAEQQDEDEQDSYMSLGEAPPHHLLNEEWDYQNGSEMQSHNNQMDIDMLDEEDQVIESLSEQQEYDEEMRRIMNMGEDQQSSDEEEDEEEEDSEPQEAYDEEDGSDVQMQWDQLNDSDQRIDSPTFVRHFCPNKYESNFFKKIEDIVNFDEVNVVKKISKVEVDQVFNLRFFLQIADLPRRKLYNDAVERTRTIHEQKQESYVREHLVLNMAFTIDKIFAVVQRVEWNQIYRYDHFMKDKPFSYEKFQKMFATEYQGGLLMLKDGLKQKRRYGMIIDRNQNGTIVHGLGRFEMTDLMAHRDHNNPSQVLNSSDEEPEDGEDLGDGEGEGDIELEMGDDADEEDGDGEDGEDIRDFEHLNNPLMAISRDQMEQIAAILRDSNMNMSTQDFLRLDQQIQDDIIQNYFSGQREQQQPQPLPSPPESDHLAQGRVVEAPERIDEERPVSQVQQVYRKLSMQHTKKMNKDQLQAINKDGRNNGKFPEVTSASLDLILELLFILSPTEHRAFPYNFLQTCCINTNNIEKLIGSLIAVLHLTPSTLAQHPREHPYLKPHQLATVHTVQYPLLALKILHLVGHLTKIYSIAFSFLRINAVVTQRLSEWVTAEQKEKSSFEMLILLLREPIVAENSQLLSFMMEVLSNITSHFFFRSINKIVEQPQAEFYSGESDSLIALRPDAVQLLGDLLQSNYIKESLHVVSKIIMRLSIEHTNLNSFIQYLDTLMKQLSHEALKDIERWKSEEVKKDQDVSEGKIVNLMYIFYEMVKAFESLPTSEEKHVSVLKAFRNIVQYDKIQQLCEQSAKILLSESNSAIHSKIGSLLDCFFILYEVALITSNNKRKEKDIEHKHIAELGQINLNQLRKNPQAGELEGGKQVFLGKFNLSHFWRENINHPNFKIYINSNIKSKLALLVREHATTRTSIFDLPIIRVAASTPHMLSFENKRAIFKNELKRIRGKARHDVIPLEMKRDDVFQLSFDRIMRLKTEELKGKIKIDFQGEEGEDAGGLTREWYMLLSREMFNPNYALFKCGSAGNTHHPSSMSYVNSHHLGYFKFIGRIVGKALYDGYLLDAYFTPAFYKHILNLPITYLDMEEEDYDYFKSLKWILENSPIEDYLELNFTYESENFGEIQTKELLPGGTGKLVTDENKLEYVQLISYAKMATNIKTQLEAFLAGFHDLIPHKIIQIFNEKELEVMISGRPTIDIDDLRRNTQLVNYVKNDQIILWLFEVLESFDMELRTAFIQFVTGSSRVPVEGFKDLRGMNGVQKFNIHREFQQERLPRAHTCFNQLDLPNYKTKEILIEKLMLAIVEGKEGFGMI